MSVPYTFGPSTGNIPLSYLDNNFATPITIGNTSIQLGDTVSSLNNLSMANVTVTSGSVAVTSITTTTLAVNGAVTPATTLAESVGYTGVPQNSQSAAYTLVATDAGKSIVHPATDNNARTFTIPSNTSVPFPIGTAVTFINMANTVTISINTDVLYQATTGTTGSRSLGAYGIATAVKVSSTTWLIAGSNLS